jgi:hypothetical protein
VTAGRNALVVALLAMLSLSACGGGDEEGDQTAGAPETGGSAMSSGSTPSSGDRNAGAPNTTPIRISFGDSELTGRLTDNATARDLAAQLPLTLTFRDHNNVEKTAPLPRKLSVAGAPAGHDPAAGEIGYWAPGGDLVFYYDSDAPFFNGIVRIGEFDDDMDAIERQSEDFSVTIETGSITPSDRSSTTTTPSTCYTTLSPGSPFAASVASGDNGDGTPFT